MSPSDPHVFCTDCLRLRDPFRHCKRPNPGLAARQFLQSSCPKGKQKGCPIEHRGPQIKTRSVPNDHKFTDEQDI